MSFGWEDILGDLFIPIHLLVLWFYEVHLDKEEAVNIMISGKIRVWMKS